MHAESKWIVTWPSSACTELARVGGKAVGFARLAALGAPVPGGFCITTDAYRAFVAFNHLEPLVQATLASAAGEARRTAVAQLQEAFAAGTMPAPIATAILSSYASLGGGSRVAVRSSATAEDLNAASFAGGQATFLGVCGDTALLQAVQRCWASLWNERVIAYRARMGVAPAELALAVIVQRMVQAQVSGVLFTCDPVSRRSDTLVIEACRGLGESLVSGHVTPEHWELDRATLEVRLHRDPMQETMTVCQGDGVATVVLPPDAQRQSGLDAMVLQRLARLALEIESACGMPQDIEWALDHELHILQARPITSLGTKPAPENVRWESPVPRADWVRRSGGIVEYLAAPPSPLYATAQLPEVCRLLGLQFTAMSSKPRQPAYTLLNGYFYLRADYNWGLHLLLLPWRYWRAARAGARQWRQDVLPAQNGKVESLRHFDSTAATDDTLLEHVEHGIHFNARAWDEAVRASRTYVFTEPLFIRLHAWFVRPLTGGDPVVFLRGFPSRAMEGERVLSGLVRDAWRARPIRACLGSEPDTAALQRLEAEAPGWMQALRLYCDTYGHASTTHDYLEPTAADSVLEALRAIRMRMALPPSDPSARQAAVQREREVATAETLAKLARHPLRRRLFQWALAWAQEGAASREDIFFHAFRGRPIVRRAMLELGRRLCSHNVLDQPEDIFFLEWQEVRPALRCLGVERRAVVAERRALHATRCALTPPPRVTSSGSRSAARRLATLAKRALLNHAKVAGDHILQGAPVSPGVVTGRARIVRTTQDLERLQAGDILVARTATPEWIVSFAVVAGLVTDVGGPLSHSSIIAREYGLPSVMGVQQATLAITEGQMITLDGSSGLVRLH